MSSLSLLPKMRGVAVCVRDVLTRKSLQGRSRSREGGRWSLVAPAESLERKRMGSSLYIKCVLETMVCPFILLHSFFQESALGATCLPGPESSSLEKEVTQTISTQHSGSKEIVPSIQDLSGVPVASTTFHPCRLRVTYFSIQTQPSTHRFSMSLLFTPGKIYKKRVSVMNCSPTATVNLTMQLTHHFLILDVLPMNSCSFWSS